MKGSLISVLRVLLLRGLGVLISLATAIGIAFQFGAGPLTDAFFLVRRTFGSLALLIETVSNVLLVPVLVKRAQARATGDYLRDQRRSEWRVFVAGAAVGGLILWAAPWLVAVIAPGLPAEASEAAAVYFTLMALTLPFTCTTAFVGSALTAIRQFSISVAVKLLPRVLILLAILLVPLGFGMTAVVVAAVLGHVVMLLALMMLRRRIEKQDAAREPVVTSKPGSTPERAGTMVVIAIYSLAVTISESYAASFAGVGAIAILALGQRISTLGVSEMLNSVLNVYYTNFSELDATPDAYRTEVQAAMRTAFFLIAPLTLCLAVLASDLAQLTLANGAFSEDAARQAGQLVAWFAMAALANTGVSVLETAILARSERHMTRHFLVASATVWALRIAAIVVLLPHLGVAAIGAAAVLGPIVMFLWHNAYCARKLGAMIDTRLMYDLARVFVPAAVTAVLCAVLASSIPADPSKFRQAITLVFAFAVAVPTYLALCQILGVQDARTMISALKGRLGKMAKR